MNNDGFILADSIFSVFTLTVIVTVLIPAVLMLEEMNRAGEEELGFHRQLFLELKRYEDYDSFIKNTERYDVKRGEICDKRKMDLCFIPK